MLKRCTLLTLDQSTFLPSPQDYFGFKILILENSAQYIGVERCIYYGRKKTNKLLVHSCRSVSQLPTHSLMSGQPRNRPVGMNLWFICLFPPTIYICIYIYIGSLCSRLVEHSTIVRHGKIQRQPLHKEYTASITK